MDGSRTAVTLSSILLEIVGFLLVVFAGLGTGGVMLVATVFWLGYRTVFVWPVAGPALLPGSGSALLGVGLLELGRRLEWAASRDEARGNDGCSLVIS